MVEVMIKNWNPTYKEPIVLVDATVYGVVVKTSASIAAEK